MRYTRKLINRKRKKIRNMKGGTKEAIAEAIDETLKIAKQMLKLSADETEELNVNTSKMIYLSNKAIDVWNNAYDGGNVLTMSVTDDEKRQLEEELARLEEEFEKEGKGIKRKKKSSTKRSTKRSTKKRKQKGGGTDKFKESLVLLNASIANAEKYPEKNKGLIITLKRTRNGVLKSAIIEKNRERVLSASRAPASASAPAPAPASAPAPPPSRNSPSRRSPSRRSATRKFKSMFSCFPGMSCTNAKGIRKKRRRRTRRKR